MNFGLLRKEQNTRNVSQSFCLSKEMPEQKMTYIPNNKRLEERRQPACAAESSVVGIPSAGCTHIKEVLAASIYTCSTHELDSEVI